MKKDVQLERRSEEQRERGRLNLRRQEAEEGKRQGKEGEGEDKTRKIKM